MHTRAAAPQVAALLRATSITATPVVLLNAFTPPSPISSRGAFPSPAVAVAPVAYLFYPFAVVGGSAAAGAAAAAAPPPPQRMALVRAYPSRYVLYAFIEEDKAYMHVADWAECPPEAALQAAVGQTMERLAAGAADRFRGGE